ncbi:PH domain-containing protein [Luteococcus sp. OSA5]|uniref:PH domain-containing protein n=1 Tax=Luteococcus sp. OSA5 TaxID=3401630 RepID=UPI003B436316
MRPVVIVQSSLGRVGSLVALALACGLLVLEAALGGPVAALRALPWLALVALACWLLWSSPRVVLGHQRLRIDNPLLRHDIAWHAITGVRNHWGLVVEAEGRSHKAWAAPARSGASLSQGRAEAQRDLQPSRADAPALHLDLDARAAELMVAEEARLRRNDSQDEPERVTSVHWARIALLVGLVLGCGATLL